MPKGELPIDWHYIAQKGVYGPPSLPDVVVTQNFEEVNALEKGHYRFAVVKHNLAGHPLVLKSLQTMGEKRDMHKRPYMQSLWKSDYVHFAGASGRLMCHWERDPSWSLEEFERQADIHLEKARDYFITPYDDAALDFPSPEVAWIYLDPRQYLSWFRSFAEMEKVARDPDQWSHTNFVAVGDQKKQKTK
jgi:hypothetical protein